MYASKMKTTVLILAALFATAQAWVVNEGTKCFLYPESLTHFNLPVDDRSSIEQAFELCGTNGTVIFTKYTFHVASVIKTLNLVNCDVEPHGDIVFSTNVPYWLSHSINVGLQNQSTAWLIGGTNVSFIGHGGLIDGNGQTRYDENRDNSNQRGRPITITFSNSTNLFVDGLSIIQPQFWAIFVSYSQNVTMNNIYVNATTNSKYGIVNTDGADTWNSRDIVMRNWTVQNGDDCIAAKGNTTNLYVQNVTCYGGSGLTIGSVGQYPLTPDYDENILFEDITILGSMDGTYIKTWQGVNVDDTGNGGAGGGGSGLVRNITFRHIHMEDVALPIQITQCIYTESGSDICDTSRMQIRDVTFEDISGTSRYNIAASLHCASLLPCPGIFFKNVSIVSVNESLGLPLYDTPLQHEVFQCANIVNQNTTSGIPCNHWAPGDFGQGVSANVQ
ncbi:hypothetical protein LTR10_006460 [Elasticomyces elasticus]|nr:hypothetical protein LTR10_006460 [Elasticomyces elasticus]KAK4973144.1 hypothetical protein LTR42_006438 [Elasticomyces elasticus]